MKLDTWRKENNLSYSELARKLGQSETTMARRWCYPPGDIRQLIPRKGQNMDRIIEVTGGAVMPNDFYMRDE